MSSQLLAGLMLGLFGSLHCLAMCGPLALLAHQAGGGLSKGWYHAGRLLTYALLGAALGMIGASIQLAGWQEALSLGAGIFLALLLLLQQASGRGWWGFQRLLQPMRSLLLRKDKNALSWLGLGMLNGLLPCGLVYTALGLSFAQGSPMQASLLMLSFGVGTLPMLLAGVWLGTKLLPYGGGVQVLLSALHLLVAALLIARGLALDIPYISPFLAALGPEASIPVCR